MSGSKFFIWGGERWRELNIETGQIEGWFRRARFVSVRRGRLRVSARRRVLSALQAHAVGQPSPVSLGARLSMLSKESISPRKDESLPSAAPVPCEHHHCCLDTHRCHTNNNISKTCCHGPNAPNWSARNGDTTALTLGDITPDPTPNTNDALAVLQRGNVSTQQSSTVDVAVQHVPRDHRPFTIHLADATGATSSSTQRHILNANSQKPLTGTRRLQNSRAPPLDALLRKHASPIKRPRNIPSDSEDSEKSFRRPSKTRRRDVNSQERAKENRSKTERNGPTSSNKVKREDKSDSENSDDADEVCKELTISESDVLALRSYVARTRRDALARFDADDAYKRMLFYAINPLVDVERCAHTERALRERHAMALPHYAARLGLVPHGSLPLAPPSPRTRPRGPVRYNERSSSPDTDKENKQNTKRNDKKRDSSNTKTVLRTKPNVDDSDSNEEYNLFRKSSDKKRGSTPKKMKNRAVEDSDSDDESDLFENSRNSKWDRAGVKSKTQTKTRRFGSETGHRQDLKVGDKKEPYSRKSILAGKKGSATEESDNDDEFRHEKNNKYNNNDKNRKDSPHKKSNRNNVSVNTDEKRQILGKANKNRNESNHKSNERKSETDDTENNDTRENRTSSNNRRESLRHRNVNQTRTSSDDSESDEQIKILKKSESKRGIQTPNGNRRQPLRHKTENQSTTSSDDSESDEKHKSVKINRGKRENRSTSPNRRESLRHRPITNIKTSSNDSSSNEQSESVKKSGNRREVLRHKTADHTTTTSDDSERDAKRKTVQNSEGKRALNNNTTKLVKNKTMLTSKDTNLKKAEPRPAMAKPKDSESDSKRKTLEKSKNKSDNRVPNDNRRESLRHRPVNHTRTSPDTSDSEEQSEIVKKSEGKRENGTRSDNKRDSLRHRLMNHTKTTSDDLKSDKKGKTADKNEGKRENRAPSGKRQDSLHPKSRNHTRTSSDISDSDEQNEAIKKSDGKREIRANNDNRRDSLRHKPMNNAKSTSVNSKSDEQRKTVEKSVGKREASGSNTSKSKQPSKATNREKTDSVATVDEPKEINTKRVWNSKLKEYSNLEDHAIVAWVSNGARARRVNGNALWRELQDDFARLAGNSRSWHSLRNRYLRYILPGMGAMRLPPAEVSRLRAAAATGEIKHKRAGISKPRRNSIFDQSSVQAASRPKRAPPTPAKTPPSPPLAPADSSDEPSEPGPSGSRSSYFVAPRAYPDVRDSPNDEEAGTSTSRRRSRRSQVSLPTPPPPPPSRGRKLFNPKQVL